MDPARYARVCDLFDQAEALPPPGRAAFLARACGEDADLRAEVERMLDAAREPPLHSARPGPPPSFTLLFLLGRGLLEGLRSPQRLAAAVWQMWTRTRGDSSREAELQALARGEKGSVKKMIGAVVVDLLPEASGEVRQRLAGALVEIVRRLRSAASLPRNPPELVALLPRQFPAFEEACSSGESPMLVLRVVSGPHTGRCFTFTGHDTFLVGRSSQAHFHLGSDDRYFSRIHFMLEANPPQVRLLDMDSHNGTCVNGARVEAPVELIEGDRIQAGHTALHVGMPGCLRATHTTTMRSAPPPPPPTLERTIDHTPAIALGGPCQVCNPTEGVSLPICAVCREMIEGQPQPIPGYSLVRELGRGGMGVVYLGMRVDDGTVVAVKTILPAVQASADEVARFLREARILCELEHPNIVGFREMGEANGRLYFAMEYVPGCDGARLLKREGPLPISRAVDIACQLLRALDHAHTRRFVHRDIKPANLLVTEREGSDHVHLADFGLARVYQASQMSGLTVTGAIGGTPAFMAPEQVTNYRESRPPVDQYAAAATLYYLLTKRCPHELAETVQEQLLRLLQDDPVSLEERRPDVPDGLANAIHRALARDPGRRFADVKAFRKALVPYLNA